MPVSKAVALADAPAVYLPELWADYRGDQSDERAVSRLVVNQASGFVEFSIREKLRGGGILTADDQRLRLGNEIVATLCRMLANGTLKGSGRVVPSPLRIDIPPGLCTKITFNFEAATVTTHDKRFEFVDVEIAAGRHDTAALVQKCAIWLRAQTSDARKILHPVARAQFPGLTTREFDDAYALAFKKSVGRPRRTQKN